MTGKLLMKLDTVKYMIANHTVYILVALFFGLDNLFTEVPEQEVLSSSYVSEGSFSILRRSTMFS